MPATSSPAARLALATGLIVFLGGCFKGWGQPQNPFNPAEGAPGEVAVMVENQNFNDATIHVFRGGERVRLGGVTGKSEERFTVRWDFTLDLQFSVQLVGDTGCRTRPLQVAAGDAVWLRIPVNINVTPCQAGK